MEFRKKVLIATGIATLLAVGLGIYVHIKKKNNEGWKLIKLPFGAKKNRRINIVRND
jgi:hypothetical protein